MTIQHIGTRAISLYIPEQELRALALSPAAIGQREALALLTKALAENHLPGWEAAELEIYTGKSAVLLFARRKSGSPRHFYFSDFEELITAAHLCPETLPSILCRAEGGYLLTVYPFEGERPPSVLCEYGQEFGGSPYLSFHLMEQGDVLLPSGALALLRGHFLLAARHSSLRD